MPGEPPLGRARADGSVSRAPAGTLVHVGPGARGRQPRQRGWERRHEGRAAGPGARNARTGTAHFGAEPAQASSTAFIEMAAFISFEIGQPVFALFAAVSNADWLAPGTPAVTSK